MSHSALVVYSIILVILVLLSAFFSSAETALMSINRYRLRHRARLKKGSAVLILKLLKRPDRLLGTILIGNTVANIFASSLATLLGLMVLGDKGVVIFTVALTLFILIFAEVAPKTVAAFYPDKIARLVAWPVMIILKLFYPLIWLINTISNGFLRLLQIKVSDVGTEPLSREELRSIVYEGTGKVPHQYQNMLLGILDLNKLNVDDVMVPQHEIVGIDLNDSFAVIQKQVATSKHDYLPVYRDNINHIIGVLHVRELMSVTLNGTLTQDGLVKLLKEPYFVPEGTLLNIQLQNFKLKKLRMAMVVDEYGEILGLLTLKDILEEIVGEFTTSVTVASKMVELQSDGSYLVDGAVTVRELDRITHWELPTKGPRTLNGLIIEYLESIPHVGVCVKIANHPIEIIEVAENRVKTARIFPALN